MSNKKFAIVDIETTGGLRKRNKIIEIGIVVFDGREILDTYQSLINPGISIPPFITKITGITDDMVRDAPPFYEIAKNIVEYTEGCVFVAHNVNFDYGFLQEHYRSLGYTYSRKKLCTVRMSRKAWPELPSHSLGNLIKHFDINVNDRHRALDDAIATTQLLKMMLHTNNGLNDMSSFVNDGVEKSRLPDGIEMETIHQLPEETGIYYFKDKDGEIVYVGKALNIKKRVKQHFSKVTRKAEKLQQSVCEIDFLLTGNELMALLIEDSEIKKHTPRINKAQKRQKPINAVITATYEEFPRFIISKKREAEKTDYEILNSFRSIKTAKSFLREIVDIYELCQCYHETQSFLAQQCSSNPLIDCRTGPLQDENPKDYHERFQLAKEHIRSFFVDDFYVVDQGRNFQEYSLIHIKDGVCDGIGYFEGTINHTEDFELHLKPYNGSKSTNSMILQYLKKNNSHKIVRG